MPHHLIDLVDPHQPFDTGRYCEVAERAVDDVLRRGKRPLFVGGTPLYLMAFFKGMIPSAEARPELRAALEERDRVDPGCLHRELEQKDPEAAARIHHRDRKRLVRALEVIEVTGRPISEQQTSFNSPTWKRPCRIVALSRPREELHERVKLRTRSMLGAGLVDETRSIQDDGGFSRQSAAAIGYAQCLDHLQGRFKDEEELRNRIRRATHRLIRRQTTWLRHIGEVRWISPEDGLPGLLAAFEG